MPDRVSPSGTQHTLADGLYSATITEAGATIRTCDWRDLPVLAGFPADAVCDGAHGQLLAPWPNRIDHGRYAFGGEQQQLDVSEPSRDNAIHGLVRWDRWACDAQTTGSVTLVHRLLPRPGYPHVVDLRVTYELDAGSGLAVTLTATNAGSTAAPWGAGHHPYLTPGVSSVRDCTLRLPAAEYLEADDRMIPRRTVTVAGTAYDFRAGELIGTTPLDPAFGALTCDGDGLARASVTAPDGAATTLWCDEAYPWLQVYTGHDLAPHRRFAAVAVEPMSCPPNAFVTGTDLVTLEPGATWTGRWGVTYTPAS